MSARIVTVTPNPSIDLLFEAGTLVWDDANRIGMPRRRAGGQGVNVSRTVHVLGGRTLAVTLLGGTTGRDVESLLRAEGIDIAIARATADTRVFVAVREGSTGRSLLLNPRGPACGVSEQRLLLDEVKRGVRANDWVVSSGSVPPGFPPEFHAHVRDTAVSTGARVVVDCDGHALQAAAAGCELLVPNVREAERLLGRHIRDARDAAAAARALLTFGARHAAITMGPDGAVLASADPDAVLVARAPEAPAGASAVGAGDAFLAALLLQIDAIAPADALRHAVATGTAVLYGEGAELVRAGMIERLLPMVNVEEAG